MLQHIGRVADFDIGQLADFSRQAMRRSASDNQRKVEKNGLPEKE